MDMDLVRIEPREMAKALVLDALASPNSKAVYRTAINRFFDWWDRQEGRPALTKMLVNRYRQVLLDSGLAPATVNLALCSIRKIALEAGDNGYLDPSVAAAIGRVPSVPRSGRKVGHWLTKEEALALLGQPDASTLIGLRDGAILAIMLGGALRRSEVAALTVEHFQCRQGRWVILNLLGKGNRVRTVPIPGWAKQAVDGWMEAAGVTEGPVFLQVRKGGHVTAVGLTAGAIYDIVAKYSDAAPHDLRRTWAKFAHTGGAPIEQIQLSLGHETLRTTELYLGVDQDLALGGAPCDYLGLGG